MFQPSSARALRTAAADGPKLSMTSTSGLAALSASSCGVASTEVSGTSSTVVAMPLACRAAFSADDPDWPSSSSAETIATFLNPLEMSSSASVPSICAAGKIVPNRYGNSDALDSVVVAECVTVKTLSFIRMGASGTPSVLVLPGSTTSGREPELSAWDSTLTAWVPVLASSTYVTVTGLPLTPPAALMAATAAFTPYSWSLPTSARAPLCAATSRMLSPPLELPADDAAELPAPLAPAAPAPVLPLLLHAATATSAPAPHSVIALRTIFMARPLRLNHLTKINSSGHLAR